MSTEEPNFSKEAVEKSNHEQNEQIDEADRHLPVANISRIMKRVLPSNAQVSKVILS
jgi:histone H3/H4